MDEINDLLAEASEEELRLICTFVRQLLCKD